MSEDFAQPNARPGKCCKCNGTGRFRWGGAMVNGVWKGKEGECYSCRGTGRQARADIARNHAYNRAKLRRLGI